MGFAANKTTLKLLQKIVGGTGQEICNSWRSDLSQDSLTRVAATFRKSASTLDQLTTCSFLLDQEIRLEPR